MKWKKKTGAWRASAPGCQFRIKQDGSLFELSVNTQETSWQKMHGYQSLEAAKSSAEELAVGITEIIYNQQEAVKARHAQAAKVANEDAATKQYRKLIRSLLKLDKRGREYAYAQIAMTNEENAKLIRETVDEIEESGVWV